MAAPQSPLVGYNTNVRHRGKLYHIQTEDSGVAHPHVITHLFADGGRIIASRKTSYAEHVGAEDLAGIVKKLMQEQHKAIFIELRDCVYDEDDGDESSHTQLVSGEDELDIDALERAAAEKVAGSVTAHFGSLAGQGAGRYRQTVAAHPETEDKPAPQPAAKSLFSGQLLQGKSLDDVILSYLADDLGEGDR